MRLDEAKKILKDSNYLIEKETGIDESKLSKRILTLEKFNEALDMTGVEWQIDKNQVNQFSLNNSTLGGFVVSILNKVGENRIDTFVRFLRVTKVNDTNLYFALNYIFGD
jgi:hypothetical protein